MKKEIDHFFKEAFDYNYYCNRALVSACVNIAPASHESAKRLLSRILNLHQAWNVQIDKELEFYDCRDLYSSENFQFINRRNYFNTLLIIDKFNISRCIEFKTKAGGRLEHKICDMLFQIIYRSAYYRGQIAYEVKKVDFEDTLIDYVFYKKEMDFYADQLQAQYH